MGGALSVFPIFLALRRPGHSSTRYVIAVSQMMMSSLLIHITGGRIETHFHVFGSLAFSLVLQRLASLCSSDCSCRCGFTFCAVYSGRNSLWSAYGAKLAMDRTRILGTFRGHVFVDRDKTQCSENVGHCLPNGRDRTFE